MRDSSQHSLSPDGNQSKILSNIVMNKSSLAPLPGGKKTLTEELNLRLKDTYSSPVIGLKYSHERMMEKYNKEVLGARHEKYREILEKIKEKARPMNHDQIHKHEMEYMSNRIKERDLRQSEVERQVADARLT